MTACGGGGGNGDVGPPFSVQASKECYEERGESVRLLPGWGLQVQFRSLGGLGTHALFFPTIAEAKRVTDEMTTNVPYIRLRNVSYPSDRPPEVLQALVACLRPAQRNA
jgi:hypothetical protein